MTSLARELWRITEPLHQVAYRSPRAAAAYEALGLTTPPQQYFANRLAALGPIGPRTAVAVLHGFAPDYVGSAVPEVWSIADPSDVCRARVVAASETLGSILGHVVERTEFKAAEVALRTLAAHLDFAGSPLGAAWADLPRPTDNIGSVWHSCTVLREHRGDAHWRATASAGIDSVECHLLHAADGAMPEELLKRVSGWDDVAWIAAERRLEKRGLLTRKASGDLVLSEDGRTVKNAIEDATDAHANVAIAKLGTDAIDTLRRDLRPATEAVIESGFVAAWKMREERWRDR